MIQISCRLCSDAGGTERKSSALWTQQVVPLSRLAMEILLCYFIKLLREVRINCWCFVASDITSWRTVTNCDIRSNDCDLPQNTIPAFARTERRRNFHYKRIRRRDWEKQILTHCSDLQPLCLHSYGIKMAWHTNSMVLSPQSNYTDWAPATCRRNAVPTFVYRGVSRGQRGRSSTVVNLSFLDRNCYFSFK
jgi:hypothetical protein